MNLNFKYCSFKHFSDVLLFAHGTHLGIRIGAASSGEKPSNALLALLQDQISALHLDLVKFLGSSFLPKPFNLLPHIYRLLRHAFTSINGLFTYSQGRE